MKHGGLKEILKLRCAPAFGASRREVRSMETKQLKAKHQLRKRALKGKRKHLFVDADTGMRAMRTI